MIIEFISYSCAHTWLSPFATRSRVGCALFGNDKPGNDPLFSYPTLRDWCRVARGRIRVSAYSHGKIWLLISLSGALYAQFHSSPASSLGARTGGLLDDLISAVRPSFRNFSTLFVPLRRSWSSVFDRSRRP